jgi:hypothetical protein
MDPEEAVAEWGRAHAVFRWGRTAGSAAAAPATASAGRRGTAPLSSGSEKNSSGPDRRRRRPLHLRGGAPLEDDSVGGAGV